MKLPSQSMHLEKPFKVKVGALALTSAVVGLSEFGLVNLSQISFLFLISAVSISFSKNSLAQSVDAGAIQQQLQRQVDREKPRTTPESLIKKPSQVKPAEIGSESIDVKTFDVQGITLITMEQAQEVLTPYENKKLSLAQIKEAANAVTSLYNKIGRTAQAVVPPQNITKGIIKIKIIEGKFGESVIQLDPQSPSRLKSEVLVNYIQAQNKSGDFLDTFGLERSLALLNELPGTEVSGELSPGKDDGMTDVIVNAKDNGIFSGRVEASNYGAVNTGAAQSVANLNLANLSGYGDLTSLDVIGSEGSIYGQVRVGAPIGYSGWKASIGASALDYKTLSSFNANNITKGTAQTYGVYTQYALERLATSNKTFVMNYENKKYVNNSVTTGLEQSKYEINDFTFGINGSNNFSNSDAYWGANVVLGNLAITNATQLQNDQSGAATQGSFAKLTFNGSYTQPFFFDKTNITANFYGQLANKNLNSAEQIYLGGPYGVRAYPVAQGGGSQGATASVEVNRALDMGLVLGAFFDAGYIQQYVNTNPTLNLQMAQTNAGNNYQLYATGLSAKYNIDKVQISGSLAWRVGNNPLYSNYNGVYQQLNTDNAYRKVQGWIKGTIFF